MIPVRSSCASMIVRPLRRTMQNDGGSFQNRSYSKPSLSRYQFAVATTSSTMKWGATCQWGLWLMASPCQAPWPAGAPLSFHGRKRSAELGTEILHDDEIA